MKRRFGAIFKLRMTSCCTLLTLNDTPILRPATTHISVAVAVRAMIGMFGYLSLNEPSRRYSSRKSWPHSYENQHICEDTSYPELTEIQCA